MTVLEWSRLGLALAVTWLLSRGLALAAQNTTAGENALGEKMVSLMFLLALWIENAILDISLC